MKKLISTVLVLLLCLSCVGCGAEKEDAGTLTSANLPKNVDMYAPGTTIDTDFGTVTVVDAAFCTKAQIYYTKTSRSSKTTINGKTTESYEETIHPGYISAMDNKLVFALKTVMTNTTNEDLEISKLQAKVNFAKKQSCYFSKGGNFHISDEAYKILPAGGSSEIVLAALVPVEQYLLGEQCLVEISGAKLGFQYDSINVYNVLGFQDGDNTGVSIDEVIQGAADNTSHKPEPTEAPVETEPMVAEAELEMTPGVYTRTGALSAEGRAVVIENVTLGFREQLPAHILKKFDHNADKLTLNDSQLYAVVQFKATNLTTDTVDLADLHDDFMIQLNYDNGFLYSTDSDVYSVFESGANMKMLRSSSSSGQDISVSPLASAVVTAYIPCAKQVAQNTDKSLIVTFISKYSGNESFDFEFLNRKFAGGSANTSAENNGGSANQLVDPDVSLVPGVNKKTGANLAEGRALTISNVQLGFQDQLPLHIRENFDHNMDKLTLNDSQTYSVIVFTVTNQTTETVDLADLHDDFLVQMTYNNSYHYSTNTDLYAVFESGSNLKMVRKNGSSGHDIAVSPLTTVDVAVYIPCAKQIVENPDKPLKVTFSSKYSGNESYEFTFDRTAPVVTSVDAAQSAQGDVIYPYPWVDSSLTNLEVELHDCFVTRYENGNYRFNLTFTASKGMHILAADMAEVSQLDLKRDTETTGEMETYAFDVDQSVLENSDGIAIGFFNRDETEYFIVFPDMKTQHATKTKGVPVGSAKEQQYSTGGNVQVYGVNTQLLDNGYVRFSVDCAAPEGRTFSFFNPPNGDVFMYLSSQTTSGTRETLVIDIKQEEMEAADSITIKFISDEDSDDYIFMNAPF